MTEEETQRLCESIEKWGREICKSRESAMAYIERLEERTGIPFNEDRAAQLEERLKKKNNA